MKNARSVFNNISESTQRCLKFFEKIQKNQQNQCIFRWPCFEEADSWWSDLKILSIVKNVKFYFKNVFIIHILNFDDPRRFFHDDEFVWKHVSYGKRKIGPITPGPWLTLPYVGRGVPLSSPKFLVV